MDFMKVFDQTVREIKREVNLKVLKVPEIEQKVLDATDNEPWGPHGSALAEIAQATKKYIECQMVMNVLWTRLGETGKDWRYVYKALAVIEYLIANGSERAVDDIVEHTFQISSLTGFEYVEPNGKDSGINVRKKAENIVALLNNKDKIQEVRNKAASTREKYVGLSSTGMSYKSTSASQGSSKKYGGFSGRYDGESYKDKDEDQFGEDKYVPKSRQGSSSNRKTSEYGSKDQYLPSSGSSKLSHQTNSDDYNAISHQNSNAPSNTQIDENEDDDDFDPRGTTKKPAFGSSQPVDLFGDSLIGDLLDVPTSVPPETSGINRQPSDDNLFADADFVSAAPKVETVRNSQTQPNVDLFATEPALSPAVSSTIDFFSSPEPVAVSESKSNSTASSNLNFVDPFASVPLNSFDQSDIFGAFTSQTDQSSSKATQYSINNGNTNNLSGRSVAESKAPAKEGFQVKSGIWSDSLSRGLIDLNITAPKKVNLADIGIVGGLGDDSEKQKGAAASYYMGSTMGMGASFGKTTTNPSSASGDDFFSSFNSSQYQFGGFQK